MKAALITCLLLALPIVILASCFDMVCGVGHVNCCDRFFCYNSDPNSTTGQCTPFES